MKFMNFLYKIFGFETDEPKAPRKTQTKATYNLKITQKVPDEIDGIRVFYPEEFNDAKEKVELLKKNTPFFLDLRSCNNVEKNKIVDYYNGVIDVLGATSELVDKNLYIFLPKNMEIEKEN